MGEHIFDVVCGLPGRRGRFGEIRLFDLIFTDRMLVVVVAQDLPVVTGGFSGAMYQEALEKAVGRRLFYGDKSLDALAARDRDNTAVPYTTIEKARVGGLIAKTLRFRVGGSEYYLATGKERPRLKALCVRHLPGFIDR